MASKNHVTRLFRSNESTLVSKIHPVSLLRLKIYKSLSLPSAWESNKLNTVDFSHNKSLTQQWIDTQEASNKFWATINSDFYSKLEDLKKSKSKLDEQDLTLFYNNFLNSTYAMQKAHYLQTVREKLTLTLKSFLLLWSKVKLRKTKKVQNEKEA